MAETDALTGNHVPALKRKLDNYVAYARSGNIAPQPSTNTSVIIRVDLYAQPDQMIVMFLQHYRTLLQKQGLGFEVSLNQQDLPL